jgi:phage terminase small subunit
MSNNSKSTKSGASLTAGAVPAHLSATSQAIWKDLNTEYDFNQAELGTLLAGLEHRDLAATAREQLRAEGFTQPGTTKVHPAVTAAKTSDMVWLACCRQLGLHLAEK